MTHPLLQVPLPKPLQLGKEVGPDRGAQFATGRTDPSASAPHHRRVDFSGDGLLDAMRD